MDLPETLKLTRDKALQIHNAYSYKSYTGGSPRKEFKKKTFQEKPPVYDL